MARYLGNRTAVGVQDGTAAGGGSNINPYLPGTGWVVVFDPVAMSAPEPDFEVFHIALDGPVGSLGTVLIDGKPWSFFNGWANEWDPSQAMPLNSGNSLQFAWNVAFAGPPYNKTSNIQPTVTVWLRRTAVEL